MGDAGPASVTAARDGHQRSRRHHLDERDDGAAEGRGFDHRGLEAAVATAGVSGGAIRPPARCHAVRARRLHGQAVGAARGDHRRHPRSPGRSTRWFASSNPSASPSSAACRRNGRRSSTTRRSQPPTSRRSASASARPRRPARAGRAHARAPRVLGRRATAMTESPSITAPSRVTHPRCSTAASVAPEGVEVELRDDEGRAVADGDVGRVHVRSACACVATGATRPARPRRSRATGGCAAPTSAGSTATATSCWSAAPATYIRGGYNVHPLEVEHVLAEHPAVAQVASSAFPRGDRREGRRLRRPGGRRGATERGRAQVLV